MMEYRIMCYHAIEDRFGRSDVKIDKPIIETPTILRTYGTLESAKWALKFVRRFFKYSLPIPRGGKYYQWGPHIQCREVTEWEVLK